MRATTIMLAAWGALIISHWAANKPTVSVKQVVEMTFAVIVIAFLDQGNTEPIAKGFAWLFLAAVLLSNNDNILQAVSKAGNTAKQPNTGSTPQTAPRVTGPQNKGAAPTITGA